MPLPEFHFESGVFRKFRVVTKIHCGGVSKDIPEKTIVDFDGTVVKFGTEALTLPGFAGALRLGWAVPVEDNVGLYVPKAAGVQMHEATKPGVPTTTRLTVSEDETQVGTVDASIAKRNAGAERLAAEQLAEQKARRLAAEEARAAQRKAEIETLTEIDYKLPPATPQASDAEVQAAAEALADIGPKKARGMEIVGLEDQEAVPVAKLSNPAKMGGAVDDTTQMAGLDPVHGAPLKLERLVPPRPVPVPKAGETLQEILQDAAVAAPPPKAAPVVAAPAVPAFQWDKTGSVKDRVDRAMSLYGNDKESMAQVLACETYQVKRELRLRMGGAKAEG